MVALSTLRGIADIETCFPPWVGRVCPIETFDQPESHIMHLLGQVASRSSKAGPARMHRLHAECTALPRAVSPVAGIL